ncbi:MAG: cytochrome c biogenesis protein ResB, partial [Nitrospirota bacterium]|nr:cytochrome c biogenesis protein ResB [Nitrospirota bacterium]
MEENKNQTLTDKTWNLFSSITFAVVLIALIAITSIIGTIIEQNAAPERNIELIGKLFGTSLAPTLYTIFDKLGFMDMYRSWWFVALLLLLSANLTICSIDRLPRIWKLVKEPVKPLTDEQFKNLSKKELVLKGKPEKIKEAAGSAIKKAGFKFLETKEADGYQLYSEKGNYTRLGVYITHLSILLILIGALIGIFFGFKGFLNLPEGKTYSVAFTQTGRLTPIEESERGMIIEALQSGEGSALKASRQLGMAEQLLKAKIKQYGIWPLGFSITCNDFNTDFYP